MEERLLAVDGGARHVPIHLQTRPENFPATSADGKEYVPHAALGEGFANLDGRRPRLPLAQQRARWADQNHLGRGTNGVVQKIRGCLGRRLPRAHQPHPMVGPDRDNKRDNHSNKVFTHEGDQLRAFIAKQKYMVVICGDRHWQYLSIHPKTDVREYSCGPASNQHAGGWRQSDFRKGIHQYLNVTGGFLSGTVERKGGKPSLIFRWHDVKGKVLNTDVFGNE
jgi:hypothetical protein